MSRFFARGCGAALAYVVAAQGALADLTAQDVWNEWRSYMAGLGYEVAGTESMSGNALTVSDFAMSMEMPDGAGNVSFGAPQLVFTENGDGTVGVAFPDTLPLRFEATEDGETVAGEIAVTQTNSAMVISGSPQDMTYDYAASGMGIALTSLTVDGAPIPPEVGHLSVDLTDIASKTRVTIGDMRVYSQTMSAGSLSYDMAFKDPDSNDAGIFTGKLDNVTSEGSGKLPLQLDMADYQAMMASGFAISAKFAYGAGSTDMAVSGDESFTYKSSSKGGSFGVAMDASRIAYDLGYTAPAISVSSNELPFPVDFAMSALGFSIDMPVARSDDLQPFSFGLNLADFVMSDMLWMIFDQAGALPRDPATVTLESSGSVKLLADLMDPMAMANAGNGGVPPVELHALIIPKMLVSMVGSSVSGTGDFTFDNTDLVSFDGIPAPRGVAKLHIVGANALIDRLIQMGLVPEDQAMGFRMMLSMFAVPGDAPDTLDSTIEINEQGQIFANGQRIK